MRYAVLYLVALVMCGCAGLTVNTQHNEMWNRTGSKGTAKPAPHISLGPDPSLLEGMSPEDRLTILLAYANAASQWLEFSPSWTQTIGSDIVSEGDLQAQIKAAVAKELKSGE